VSADARNSSSPSSSASDEVRCLSRTEEVPHELLRLPRWVAFRLTPPKKPGDKHGKIPIDPWTGKNASSTDPKTWAPIARAHLRAQVDNLAGVGFVFNGDGICGVDLDKCRDPKSGEIEPWAQQIVTELSSYTELSPSGTGLHILVRGVLPDRGRKKGNVEIYETGRFFTVTGQRVAGTPATIENRQAEIDAVHTRIFAAPASATQQPKVDADERVLERAARAKNGAKFSALWNGETTGHPSTSEGDLALCSILSFWTHGDARAVDRLFRKSKRMRPKWDEPHGTGTFGEMTIAKAVMPSAGRVARIEIRPGELPEAVRSAQDLLLGVRPPQVFQRDRLLARLIRVSDAEEVEAVKRPGGAICLHTLDEPYLLLRLAELAEWQMRRRGGELARVDPPKALAASLLADVGNWRFPPLLGFVEAPTLRNDGSILDRQGYDEVSRLFLDTAGFEFGSIPPNPSREEAVEALAILNAPFVHFPFVSPCDRSALLAAILTALVRRSIPTAPMFLFDARTMSTGKSLLADAISLIATGRTCALMTQGHDTGEDQKRIFSVLLQGDLVACVDNIERPLEGPDYCAVTTGRTYQGRVLGLSKVVKLPSKTLWLATGNNLVIKGDLITRVVLCDLDAKCEAPEARKFEGDLREQLLAQRPQLVRAALTIMRAFVVAGRPDRGLPVFGRFEKWSAFVREPLVWLGMQDPLEGAARLRTQDPVLSGLRALTHAWRETFGNKAKSVSKAIVFARQHPEGDLAEALTELAGYGREGYDARAIGVFLRQHRGRIVNGLRFESPNHAQGVAKWVVLAEMGGMGGSPNPPRGETETPDPLANARERAHAHAHEGTDGIPPYPPVPPGDEHIDDAEDDGVSSGATEGR